MTGIANAPAFSGFDAPGGDDFSLDLAGPGAGSAPAPSEPEGGTEVAIFPWFGRRGPDHNRAGGRGNGNDGVGTPGSPDDACGALADTIDVRAKNIENFIKLADQYVREGRPHLARSALTSAKHGVVRLESMCNTFAEHCAGTNAVTPGDQARIRLACQDLAGLERRIDEKLLGLEPGMAFDLGGLVETAGTVLGGLLQLLGGIGRALPGGPAWQN